MGFKVQFTVNDTEKELLTKEAKERGYPDVAELCKDRALQGKSIHTQLYKIMVNKIMLLPKGKEFCLKDLMDTPPAELSRWLYDNVADGSIPNVERLGSDGSDAERYKKI